MAQRRYIDPSALLNRYLDKTIIYVEGDGDQRLFTRIVGPDVADQLEFRTPKVSGGGCSVVIKRVEDERPTNRKVFGLVDGETAVGLGGMGAFLACRKNLFNLSGVAQADGILFLAGHELENLILLHGGVCELVSKNVKLGNLGAVQAADVEETLLKLTRRFFAAALLKYAAFVAGIGGAPVVTISGGKLIEPSLRITAWIAELRDAVGHAGGDWSTYRAEAKAIFRTLTQQFDTEAMTDACRRDHFIRLADGKNLLIGLLHVYGKIGEGILADALTKPPYSEQFRAELMALTQAT